LFGHALDQSPQYWMNLQADFDLKIAMSYVGTRLVDIHTLVHI
jgi:antitoxin HigA-1